MKRLKQHLLEFYRGIERWFVLAELASQLVRSGIPLLISKRRFPKEPCDNLLFENENTDETTQLKFYQIMSDLEDRYKDWLNIYDSMRESYFVVHEILSTIQQKNDQHLLSSCTNNSKYESCCVTPKKLPIMTLDQPTIISGLLPVDIAEELMKDIIMACFEDLSLRRQLLDAMPFIHPDDADEAKQMLAIWTDVPGPCLYYLKRLGRLDAFQRAVSDDFQLSPPHRNE